MDKEAGGGWAWGGDGIDDKVSDIVESVDVTYFRFCLFCTVIYFPRKISP